MFGLLSLLGTRYLAGATGHLTLSPELCICMLGLFTLSIEPCICMLGCNCPNAPAVSVTRPSVHGGVSVASFGPRPLAGCSGGVPYHLGFRARLACLLLLGLIL